jgi:hypothetical protein
LLSHSPDKLLMNDFHIYRANRLLPLTPFFTVWRNKLECLNRKKTHPSLTFPIQAGARPSGTSYGLPLC